MLAEFISSDAYCIPIVDMDIQALALLPLIYLNKVMVVMKVKG